MSRVREGLSGGSVRLSHGDLVERAVRWLRNSERCPLVIGDFRWLSGECPDAMGWSARGVSTLIECKASRADFYADRRKGWRHNGRGVGDRRFYFTPKGLVRPDELPDGWGLLEVWGQQVRRIVKPETRQRLPHSRMEMAMIVNVARRLHESCEHCGRTSMGRASVHLSPESAVPPRTEAPS